MAEQHDRILGYFLEEASEHLHTIEQGLCKLPETVRQPATIRELFRAAHSIKGSAAMLGLTDVQQVGNQFEANFKLLKEQPQIAVDRQLQALFLDSFNFLRAAIADVRASNDPYRRDPATPDPIGDPVFEELKAYLQHLLMQSEPLHQESPVRDLQPEPAIDQVFGEYVTRKLGEITGLCLQLDRPEIRSQIQKICQKLGNLGENFEFLEWSNLFAACRLAIANPVNTLPRLGEIISIAVKQAQLVVLSGRPSAIQIPVELAALIERQAPVAHQAERQTEPFRVDNPYDPFASMQIEPEETTHKLNSQPTISTEQLPPPLTPVLSTVTNSIPGTTDLPAILSQSLTANMPLGGQVVDLHSGAPAIDLTTANDNFINLDTHNEANFSVNTNELDQFMNSLDSNLAAEDTWMAAEDLFDLNDNPPIDFAELSSDPVTVHLPVTPIDRATTEYDEETFYTPELGNLDDGDMANFWSNNELATPQQSIYSALDLPNSIDDRFQPDSSPALDLNIAVPEFTLDAQMSDLFPTIAPPANDWEIEQATHLPATVPAIVDESDSQALDLTAELEDRAIPLVAIVDLEPISVENWEAELPNSPLANDLTSEILFFEDLNSPILSGLFSGI